MDRFEFMDRTDSRHLQTHIKLKIKEAFRERDMELNRRREWYDLQVMLSTEELQQEEELANLFRASVLENMEKRRDWVATAKFEKTEAEREFLKLKQIQRELINCEEIRPKESKKITEETKQVQLLQMAEKRALQMKEKEIEKIWFEASMLAEKEKEKQQQYENHLKKMIANKTVGVLDGQLEHIKYIKELENEEKRNEHLKNERAKNEEAIREDIEKRRELERKVQEGIKQRSELQSTRVERFIEEKQAQLSDAKAIEEQFIQLKREEEILKMNKKFQRESEDKYLQYVKDQNSKMNTRNKMLDIALDAYGRQMQSEPTKKTPYRKSVR